ncbi:MAG: hypothetical protein K5896_11080 [Prevotella sp.]|nr:hypothetical protein [Prevotella sp.]
MTRRVEVEKQAAPRGRRKGLKNNRKEKNKARKNFEREWLGYRFVTVKVTLF